MLPFTLDALDEAVKAGQVTARRHPSLPYVIFNYSAEVQYTNRWDDVTLNCRGLILDDDGNIVARPWKKFFNLGQVDLPIQFDDPVEVMDKADGSLGILYPNGDGTYAIATRGSFASEQALHASEVYRVDYGNLTPMPGYTMLFEIIYPSNRIVLNYGDMDDLMLLGAVENDTGYYISPNQARYMFIKDEVVQSDWRGPVVEVMSHKTLSDAIGDSARPNAEGFVIRSHNFMVKLKQADYLELHRLVTNASPKTVWEQLKQGKSKSEIVSAFPDEFHDYVGGMIDPLVEKFDDRLESIMEAYGNIMGGFKYEVSRKEYAQAFTKHKDAKYFFSLLDNRSIRDVLWTELRPREIKD